MAPRAIGGCTKKREIPKKNKGIVFKNLAAIFELAISQPIQYVNQTKRGHRLKDRSA
jgi:hypothetical protein